MYNQERGIYRPSLKVHSFPNITSSKRFAFEPPIVEQNNRAQQTNPEKAYNSQLYPRLDASQSFFTKNNDHSPFNTLEGQRKQLTGIFNSGQSSSNLTVNKFDPILPKFVFKRFVDSGEVQNQTKPANNQIIQQLRVKNINYPYEVEMLFRETEQSKIQYEKQSSSQQSMQQQSLIRNQKNWTENSYKQSLRQGSTLSKIRKIPYFPLMGTDGTIFWSHSFDKVVLWKFKGGDFQMSQVFCILQFKNQLAPISAVYATQIKSTIFKNQRTILFSIAFYNQLQFFTFNINKYQKEYLIQLNKNQKTATDFHRYLEKIMIKVNSCFAVEKIIVKNVPNHSSPLKQLRPMVIFTDGGKDIEIVDLENIAAYKSHQQYDMFSIFQRKKDDKSQNQIIKLLHCHDDTNPHVNYAFVMRKQTSLVEAKPKTLIQKIKSSLGLNKRTENKEQIVLSIYEWNQTELKNDTLWKKWINPQRLKKIKQITSRQLELRLKQNFFEFSKLNANNQFMIADVSLIEKQQMYMLFGNGDGSKTSRGSQLKISFSNGASVLISNFRTLTFCSRVKVLPCISPQFPMITCQYHSYRRLLQKSHYLLTPQQVRNKFNFYMYEPHPETQKQPKYSPIDSIISECNGLNVCENKLVFEDQMQISYCEVESRNRKRIYEVGGLGNMHMKLLGNNSNSRNVSFCNKKQYLIFQNSHMTIVQTPNIAQNLLLLAYLNHKLPPNTSNKQIKPKIQQKVVSIFSQFPQQNKITLLSSLIQLTIQIQQSGKCLQSSVLRRRKTSFQDIIKGLSNNARSQDQTAYLEEESLGDIRQGIKQEVYRYKLEVNKNQYANFVEYLLGAEIAVKEKDFLKKVNSGYNGKSFRIPVNQHMISFLLEILLQQGLKPISQKSVKSQKPTSQKTLLAKHICSSLVSPSQQKYLTHLFGNITQIQQNFLIVSLSKLFVQLLVPILSLSYKEFHFIKQTYVRIIESVEELERFLQSFAVFGSYRNNRSDIFEETILFCKAIQNSIPKVALLVRLFDVLSEQEHYSVTLQNSHRAYWDEINLRNLLFKIDVKQLLCKITVQDLFDNNSVLLDQLQEKLPELDSIKTLRYFRGWRKMNEKIIQSNTLDKQINKPKPEDKGLIFNWFGSLGGALNSSSNKSNTKGLLLQHQSMSKQDRVTKQKQQLLLIEKALNDYSFEDFARYFIVTDQYFIFTKVIWSKIAYLQKTYLDYQMKYHFDQNGLIDYNNFMQVQNQISEQRQSNNISSFDNQHSYNNDKSRQVLQSIKRQALQKSKLNSFLKFQQKAYNHQKYLKTYDLIRSLNTKMIEFIARVLEIYKIQSERLQKTLVSCTSDVLNKHRYYNQSLSNKSYSKVNNQSYFEFLALEVQKIVDLVADKGSDIVKSQVVKKLKSAEIFANFIVKSKNKGGLIGRNQQGQSRFYELDSDRNYLLTNTDVELLAQDKSNVKILQDRNKMYQQKIEERYARQLLQGGRSQVEPNWMNRQNSQSNNLIFRNNLYQQP